MKFKAEIDVMPLDELLDPQGKVVNTSLPKVGIKGILDVRIGKHIIMELEAENKELAKQTLEQACKKLLANMVIEKYSYQLKTL